jgi:DNA processing protein
MTGQRGTSGPGDKEVADAVARTPPQQMTFLDAPSGSPDSASQRLTLLALSSVRGLGEASLRALTRAFPDYRLIWEASPDRLRDILSAAGLRTAAVVANQVITQRPQLLSNAEMEYDRLHRQGISLLLSTDPDYPVRLRAIKGRPEWLFVQGDVNVLSSARAVAVVGTRDASAAGRSVARKLTIWLAEREFCIVSGLAEGIDEVAHQTAIDVGAPAVAVLGTGILLTFPASTASIRQRIVEDGGAVATEYFPHDSYSRIRFVQRDRIIAGLADATVPVEGAAASGTAHTYRFARDFGRITFGVRSKSAPMQNGILGLLRQDGQPVFDLDEQSGLAALAQTLGVSNGEVTSTVTRSLMFRQILQEFNRIAEMYPVTQDDLDQLIAALIERWNLYQHGSKSGHSGS